MKTIDGNSNQTQTQDFGTWVTDTAAAGSAVTLTIPAPAAGQRVFINHITITSFAAALLTAAATPNSVTTTNLNGTPSWDFQANAAAQGTIDRLLVDPGLPMASDVVAVAVTIVAPAKTNIIWRITANYTVGNS